MKVKELAERLELVPVTELETEVEITGVYIGDLLSVVMSKCEEGNVWITVQTHMNILNVADLNDAACIIIAGDTAIEQSLIDKAEDVGVCIFRSEKEAYELAWKIHEVM